MEFTKKQQEFIDLALSGENIFLTGKAGTGKSFIIEEFIKRYGRNVVKLGTTGIAAANIEGQTIHSFFGINPFQFNDGTNGNHLHEKRRRPIRDAKVFIIDEVSMLRPDVLDAINWQMRLNGCNSLLEVQVIFVGDMKQLPVVESPNTMDMVNDAYGTHEFFNAYVYDKLNVKTVELDEIKRQSDERFIEALNKIRDGGKDEYFKRFVSESPNGGVILAPHNATVNRYNREELNKLDGEVIEFKAKLEGKINPDDFRVEQRILVKHGAKIMYCVNDKERGLINGDIGTFIVDGDKHYFEKDGRRVRLVDHDFENHQYESEEIVKDGKLVSTPVLRVVGSMRQVPIKLAYAISIHKSQGMTFDEVTIDLSRRCFVKGQMYVALSRVRTPKGLCILI